MGQSAGATGAGLHLISHKTRRNAYNNMFKRNRGLLYAKR